MYTPGVEQADAWDGATFIPINVSKLSVQFKVEPKSKSAMLLPGVYALDED
jgi:hypothetical protein